MSINATYDTRLKSNANSTNFATLKYFDVGADTSAKYRSLLYFSTIPAVFDKAVLSLNWYYPNQRTSREIVIEAYRPATSWTNSQATWRKRNSNTNWPHPGGDWIDALDRAQGNAPFGSVKVSAGILPTGYIKIDVTPLMKLYAAGTTNTGILLKTKGEYKDYMAFYSLESGTKNAPNIEFVITKEIAPVIPEPDPGQPDSGTTIVYVSNSGNSDFTCDGVEDDVQINQALTYAANTPGSTVYLRGPFTYYINNSILLPGGVTLSGDSTAKIKIAKGLPDWGYRKCQISEEKAVFMIKGSSATNVGIKNITVDGSQSDFYPNVTLGTSRFNMATLINCTGLTIYNVTWQNGCNDAILLNKCSNVTIDKITVNKCGHDGVYAYNITNINVTNSTFINRTNSSCRYYNVSGGSFKNNDCTTSGGGYMGLELQGTVKNIEVSGNNFHDLANVAIGYENCTAVGMNIHDNIVINCL